MTPSDLALNFSNACNVCKGNRCIFAAQCNGKSETCKMKEVAMTIRAQSAEIDALSAAVKELRHMVTGIEEYAASLEKIIQKYNILINAFQHSYRPAKKVTRGRKKKPIAPRKPTLDELIKMDGDKRYAKKPEKKIPPPPPLVIL